MTLIDNQLQSRRTFLRRSGRLALAGGAMPFALNLAAMGEAAAFDATDYKALVCLFMHGGNDYANSVVTYDTDSYNKYSAARPGIALGRASLGATVLNPTTALPNGRQYALHPSMTGMANLFNTGQAAVQLNVGPLVAPTTRVGYSSNDRRANPLPPSLFSHNDQQSIWQSSSPEGSTVGWGGNLGDLAQASNSTSLFTCISVSGNAVFLSGDTALQYQIGTNAAVRINSVSDNVYGSSAVRDAMRTLAESASPQVLENEYTTVTRRAISAEGLITRGLNANPATNAPFSAFTNNNPLAAQLRMVARIIASRSTLGAKRQVFMVSMGGFDSHDNLLGAHPGLLGNVSGALTEFHAATRALGIADKVTAFTASDFGRTLASNGDGSDHGWGSHHFVVGGAVRGQSFYGSAPPVSLGNTAAADDQWHVGQGRLLPSTSVDQYAATMARWFGVADSELNQILPNIGRFGGSGYPVNMGFMI